MCVCVCVFSILFLFFQLDNTEHAQIDSENTCLRHQTSNTLASDDILDGLVLERWQSVLFPSFADVDKPSLVGMTALHNSDSLTVFSL